MQTKNHQPNAAQERWSKTVRAQGCILGYEGYVGIHHVVGQAAIHWKIPIGHEFIVPCTDKAHREIEKLTYEEQKKLFLEVCRKEIQSFHQLPFSADVMWGILDWGR